MKTKSIKTALTIALSIVFAVFFMGLALQDLDFAKVKTSLSRANYLWILGAVLVSILAYGFRAVRWNLLLEPMGYQIRNSNAFWTIAFGYMMNLTIPRSGEVARATALFGVEKIPVEKSIATIVIERVVDLCFMLLFLLLTFVFNAPVLHFFFNKLRNYQPDGQKTQPILNNPLLDNTSEPVYLGVKILGVILLLGSVIFLFVKLRQKIFSFILGILEGLFSIFKMKRRGLFVLYSVGIWTCYFLSAYFGGLALEETAFLTISDVFLIITAGTLGMMVPTSGGAGTFHIAVKLAIAGILVSLGKDQHLGEEIGLTYAILSHTMQVVCMLVMGLIAMPILMRRRN